MGLSIAKKSSSSKQAYSKSKPKSSSRKFTTNKGSKCNMYNFLNVLGYVLVLITSSMGMAGWFGTPNLELSSKYQTLITPSAAYFRYVWGAIFLSNGFFAIAQVLPRFREQPLVQKGIGSVYFLACSAETAWTILFGYELMILAFVAIFVLCLTLLFILKRQWNVVIEETKKANSISNRLNVDDNNTEDGEGVEEDFTAQPPSVSYWLLRFPFGIHAGWISLATPLMLSVLLVSLNVESTVELWVAVISLPLLFGACMGLLLREEAGAPSYIFPMTVAYGCAGICWELYAPSQAILERHDESNIKLMMNLAGFCAICLMVVVIARFCALLLRDQYIKLRKKDGACEIDGEEYDYVQA